VKINGERFRQARETAHVTRADLAVVADLTHARIWQLETESESNVNLNVVKAMAKKMKCQPADLQ